MKRTPMWLPLLVGAFLLALYTALAAEARSPFSGATSVQRVVSAVRMNTRQIFKPTFKIQSKNAGVVTTAEFSHDGRWFLTASENRSVQLWSMTTGQRELNLNGHSGPVLSAAFVPEQGKTYAYQAKSQTAQAANRSGFLVSGSADNEARLWSLITGETVRRFHGHTGPITTVAVTHNGDFLITGSADQSARLWNLESGKEIRIFNGHQGPVLALALNSTDKKLATGGQDNTIQIWDVQSGAHLETLNQHDGPVLGLAWSPDGKILASGHGSGAVRLWSAGNSNSRRLAGHEGAVRAVAISPDGASLATAGDDKTARIWSLNNDSSQGIFNGHQNGLRAVSFSPGDGRFLITGSADRTARLWRRDNQQELARLVSMLEGWAVVTPDGRFDGTLDGDIEDRLDAVQWAGDGHAFSIDGFMESYYRPALLGRLLANKAEAGKAVGAPDITEGFQLPPKVTIQAPSNTATSNLIKINIEAEDMGGGINEIRVYHNGKIVDPSKVMKSGEAQGKNGPIVKMTVEAAVAKGKNEFRVVGLSRDRIESEPSTVSVLNAPADRHDPQAGAEETLHVFVVGVNQYADQNLNLDFAVPDAKGMLSFFTTAYARSFKKIKAYEIYDNRATRASIMQSLEGLRSIPPDDTILLYFAGHGEAVKDSWYFIPHELNSADDAAVSSQGVSSLMFKQRISEIAAHKIILLFDACKSGAAMDVLAEFQNQRPMALLSRATGIHIATATTSQQSAYELTALGHGVFTYALLQGLKGQADQDPKDGQVSTKELLAFIQFQIPYLNRKFNTGAQNPVTNSKGGHFVVAKP